MTDRQLEEFLKKVTILPDDEYQRQIKSGGMLVCVRGASFEFPDNMHGKCGICQCVIHFRPYNKDALLKVCMECAMKAFESQDSPQ